MIMKYGCSWVLAMLLLSACAKPPTEAARTAPAHDDAVLKLEDEEIKKLGLVSEPLVAVQYEPETEGLGVVLSHDAIAVAAGEVMTARAAVNQSQAVLSRLQRLAGSDGAASVAAVELAEHQAGTDVVALELAERKASMQLGQKPPWHARPDSPVLASIASGRAKLIRVTFPLGALAGTAPRQLRFSSLDSTAASQSWVGAPVWDAPADPAMPGRSFFALLDDEQVAEGERLLARATIGKLEDTPAGVLVPASALVLSGGQSWCYVEHESGQFERTALAIDRPMRAGFFSGEPLAAGDRVVVAGAGLLLSREINPSKEAD